MCQGITQKGLQCRRSSRDTYCWQHTWQASSTTFTTIPVKSNNSISTINVSYSNGSRRCRGLIVEDSQCKNVLVHASGEYCWQHTYQAEGYESTDSESGSRRCRGMTLKRERCKRMLVHYPGHYCWQHTDQTPEVPVQRKKRTEEYFSNTTSTNVIEMPIRPPYIPPAPQPIVQPVKPLLPEITASDSSDTENKPGVEEFVEEDSGFFEVHSEDESVAEEESDTENDDIDESENNGGFNNSSDDSLDSPSSPTTSKVPVVDVTLLEDIDNYTKEVDLLPENLTSDSTILVLETPPAPPHLPTDTDSATLFILEAPPAPTHTPTKPIDPPSFEVTIWTVAEVSDETEEISKEQVAIKSQKPKRNRSCGLGWVVTAILSPFNLRQKPVSATSMSSKTETPSLGNCTQNRNPSVMVAAGDEVQTKGLPKPAIRLNNRRLEVAV